MISTYRSNPEGTRDGEGPVVHRRRRWAAGLALALLAGALVAAAGPPASAGSGTANAAEADEDATIGSEPAKLQIHRALIRDQRLVVRGSLDAAAAGEELVARFRAAGRLIVLRPTVMPDGRFRVAEPLRGTQRRAQAGRLAVSFAGNEELREAAQLLRAAREPVRLRVQRAAIEGNLLVVAGQVVPQGGRQVRGVVEFIRRDGTPAQLLARAEVDEEGRWSFRRNVPVAVRNFGAWLSVTHVGRARFYGQRRGQPVGG
jgi:hypothetical protein